MGTFVARAEKSYEVPGDFFSQPKQSVKQHLKGGAMSFCTISLWLCGTWEGGGVWYQHDYLVADTYVCHSLSYSTDFPLERDLLASSWHPSLLSSL